MTDAELSWVVRDLEKFEGTKPYLYLDTRGHATIGLGFLVKDEAAFRGLPLRIRNDGIKDGPRDAAPPEKTNEFRRVVALGQTTGDEPRRAAPYYRAHATLVYLREVDIEAIAKQRLETEFVPGIARLLPTFESFPPTAKWALVDLAWNLGVDGLGKFGGLLACCKARDWAGAALESSVRTSRPERNKWRADQFRQAAEDEAKQRLISGVA